MSDDDPLRFDYEVSNVADLIAVVKTLQENLEARPEDWENVTLGSYLQAMQAWLSDSAQQSASAEASWRLVADVLRAGRIYE